MKILITGISSILAELLAERLTASGHEIVGIDWRHGQVPLQALEICHVDLRKRAAEDLFRRHRPDVVVHMATIGHLVRESEEERYRINLGGTRAVFEHAKNHGAEHVVFVGRHTYYGAAPDSPLYHSEDEPPLGLAGFPELADLVAADLYAGSALWRFPAMATTVMRMCYTLGPTGHGSLAAFMRLPYLPCVLGFDPLVQFMAERDTALAIAKAIERRARGVFNVCGPAPVPLSVLARATGRRLLPLPEPLLAAALGRFGLPKLSRGALGHIKYPIVIDGAAFRAATGFAHTIDEAAAMDSFARAFPARSARAR